MPRCDECGEAFDTERGVWIHSAVEHDEMEDWEGGSNWQKTVDVLGNSRYAFFLGFLAGMVVVTMLAFSSASPVQGDATDVGRTVLHHYEERAPPGVTYTLGAVEEHPSGTYAVTLRVASGAVQDNRTVYATRDGQHVFESPPVELEQDISALGG
ncbi:MAG: hypothetical protein SVU88_04050 [Candidatus Nanohaloarchaea archaeon]|nr:hypothetical protein [Candidatus Nanohaloarchaea archaeon]